MRQFYHSYPSLIPSSEILHALREKSAPKSEGTEKLHALRGKSDGPEFSDATPRKFAASAVAPVLEIGHALRSESWQPGRLHPNLSRAHYRTLLRVHKRDAGQVYLVSIARHGECSGSFDMP